MSAFDRRTAGRYAAGEACGDPLREKVRGETADLVGCIEACVLRHGEKFRKSVADLLLGKLPKMGDVIRFRLRRGHWKAGGRTPLKGYIGAPRHG